MPLFPIHANVKNRLVKEGRGAHSHGEHKPHSYWEKVTCLKIYQTQKNSCVGLFGRLWVKLKDQSLMFGAARLKVEKKKSALNPFFSDESVPPKYFH